ncbi:hypothetical protein LJC09_04200 [Desulfovibrio sp. OttesenSCG-928-F20]|nr:hypothetical protein [Desulfovibrio sp. OttesenSCG-928-F20]
MNYYTIDESGNITACADFKFDCHALETDKDIVQGHDGWLYLKGDEPQKPLSVINRPAIAEIDNRIAALETAAARPAIVIADIVSLAAAAARPYTDEERYALDLEGAWLAEYREEIEALRSTRRGLVG